MKYVGRRKGGEIKGTHGGGLKQGEEYVNVLR